MSSSSTSSSPRPSRATQPSCAQLDASYSPARLASRNTSEDEDSDSSVSRLLRQEANDSDTDVNIDGDSGRGAEDYLETAPRRRNHGELRELVEGVDYDLTDLHEPDPRVSDHPPPPELLYESFEDALTGVTTWAKDHGVSYNKQRWVRGGRCRLLMACYRRGKAKPHEAGDHEAGESSVPRRRPGAVSQKTDCKMQFWLVVNDNTQPDGQWRVKWCENRASISHILLGRLTIELTSNIMGARFSAKLAEQSVLCATSDDSGQHFRASTWGARHAH